jgi:hypothetical protein
MTYSGHTRVIEICWECWKPIYTISDPYFVSHTHEKCLLSASGGKLSSDLGGPLWGLWHLHGRCFDKRVKND